MPFPLFDDIKNLFTAVKTASKLAKEAGLIGEKEEKKSQGFMDPGFNFDSSLRAPAPPLQTMDQPRGIAVPRVGQMYSELLEITMRDNNIRQIQQNTVAPARPVGKPVQLGALDSVRKSRIDRSVFRKRLTGS